MGNSQALSRLLYSLKRQWGKEFDYVQILSSDLNDRTGDREISRSVFRIPAVLLPQSTVRKFIQDIGYLAADKNFTYGGLNDFNKLTLLIDKNDLPEGFNENLNGYVNYGHKRFEMVKIDNLFEIAFLLTSQGVEGANPYAVISRRVESVLGLNQRVSYELN